MVTSSGSFLVIWPNFSERFMGTSKASDHSSASGVAKQGFVTKAVDELKKISFPTRAETVQATLVTIVIMTVVSLCLVFMDLIFDAITKSILS
jgi:preprotein translocase SecE subunit